MSAEQDIIQAREEMATILDQKLSDMTEWKAFRAMDKAIAALKAINMTLERMADGELPPDLAARNGTLVRKPRVPRSESYAALAIQAINREGRPLHIDNIVAFIAGARGLSLEEGEQLKVAIGSGLSRDRRLRSVVWHGGRGWWYSNQELPQKESAGPSSPLATPPSESRMGLASTGVGKDREPVVHR
jgi:hypothetical protein